MIDALVRVLVRIFYNFTIFAQPCLCCSCTILVLRVALAQPYLCCSKFCNNAQVWMSLHKSRLCCIADPLAILQYCIGLRREVWSLAELHYWRGLEVWSGSIGRSEREPMLPWRRTLLWITIFCANYLVELVQSNLCALCKVLSWITIVCAKCLLVCILPPLAHQCVLNICCRSIVSSDQRSGTRLHWRHRRIPPGIPASVTPGRALCPRPA